eukprot:TRINITY_DN5266_c0_g2_i1.p1 TRINITY_DN5266_c0_g2~~TRINITY_DN5266_c0_g2_i1.p1  ORF type:complete len:496 (-),score=58.31 TRINITY_DN5266_c0_g2_i1:805-2292(-)
MTGIILFIVVLLAEASGHANANKQHTVRTQLLEALMSSTSFKHERLGFSAQYTCSLSAPSNAPSAVCQNINDGDSCTPRCNTGYRASISGSLECTGGTFSPASYSCVQIQCPVICRAAFGASCVAGPQTFTAAAQQAELVRSTTVAIGATVKCLNSVGVIPAGAATGLVCAASGALIDIYCGGDDALSGSGGSPVSTETVVTFMTQMMTAATSSPSSSALEGIQTIAGVLSANDVPFGSSNRCFPGCDTSCQASSTFVCAPCSCATRQAGVRDFETLGDADAVARQLAGGGGYPLVVCNQASATEQEACFESAACAGLLTAEDRCSIGGIEQSCPACTTDGGDSTGSDTGSESKKGLLLLLLLLLLIPFCLSCILLLLAPLLLRRKKATGPVPLATAYPAMIGPPPMVPLPPMSIFGAVPCGMAPSINVATGQACTFQGAATFSSTLENAAAPVVPLSGSMPPPTLSGGAYGGMIAPSMDLGAGVFAGQDMNAFL